MPVEKTLSLLGGTRLLPVVLLEQKRGGGVLALGGMTEVIKVDPELFIGNQVDLAGDSWIKAKQGGHEVELVNGPFVLGCWPVSGEQQREIPDRAPQGVPLNSFLLHIPEVELARNAQVKFGGVGGGESLHEVSLYANGLERWQLTKKIRQARQ